MSDIPAEGLRFIASAVRRGANPPGVPALLDEAAAELTRLRDDLAAAQEREQRMRGALLGVLNFMENTESELGIKLDSAERARSALGEPQ